VSRVSERSEQFWRTKSGIHSDGRTYYEHREDGTPKLVFYIRRPNIIKGDHHRSTPYSCVGAKLDYHTHRTEVDHWYEGGHLYGHHETVYPVFQQDAMFWNPGGSPDADNALAEADTKALNDLVPNAMNLGASLGEGSQTTKMFRDSGMQLIQSLLAAYHGNWAAVARILGLSKAQILSGRFPANKWLEYQYGWKPLMSDLYTAQQKVHEDFENDRLVTGKATSGASRTIATGRYGGNGLFKQEIGFKTGLVARVSRAGLQQANSWGLVNPLSIAWELVPFSFVVDWVMPIGNTLSALTATAGLEFVDGYRNYKEVGTFKQEYPEVLDSYYGGTRKIESRGGTFGTSQWYFERWPLNSFPMPKVYVTSPFMNKDGELKTNRVLNALSLLRGLF